MDEMTMTETALEDHTEAKQLAEVLAPIITANTPAAPRKDRSNGNSKHLKPIQKGEIRNPKGNPRIREIGLANSGMQRVKGVYKNAGYSPEQVAKRMTHWLDMPYDRALAKINNPKTPLFERLGISIIINATENADTSKLGNLLDRIIGPVIQHTKQDIQSLQVTAKADVDLLTRIQSDMQQGKLLVSINHDEHKI